jgi:CheY-like chemotaxis protein
MIRFLIGEAIELRTRLAADLPNVSADPVQMEQLLINFCVNARDAMPNGGRVLIETQILDVVEGIAGPHSNMKPGRYVQLSVSDTGVGIDQQTASRIFEPFFTTKATEKGAGLGLATVHCIVKQSRGYVRVESEPDHGAVFFVSLPAATSEGEPFAADETTLLDTHRGSETVLVVESAASLRTLIREILRGFGYSVFVAADGRQALELAAKRTDLGVLLLDMALPGNECADLVRSLREVRPELKVLQMTAPPSGFVNYRFHGAGTDFIQKPFTAEALAQKLRQLLDHGDENG